MRSPRSSQNIFCKVEMWKVLIYMVLEGHLVAGKSRVHRASTLAEAA